MALNPSTEKDSDMTAYSNACYFARQAADSCRYMGLSVKGFSRLAAPLHGAIWQFTHEATGLVILLNSSGAVNAKATKARRESIAKAAKIAAYYEAERVAQEAAAALAAQVKSAKEAQAMAREIEREFARLAAQEAESYEGEEKAPGLSLAEVAAMRRRWPSLKAARPAFSFPLAPFRRNLESPLIPMAAATIEAVLAYGRGAF